MAEKTNLSTRWSQYRPTKPVWFWSCAGSVAVALVLGFTVGGWVTGGTASELAETSARDAQATLAAALCVEQFAHAPNAQANWAELKEASSYQQDNFIADGGWARLAGESYRGADQLCADALVGMERLPVVNGAAVPGVVPTGG